MHQMHPHLELTSRTCTEERHPPYTIWGFFCIYVIFVAGDIHFPFSIIFGIHSSDFKGVLPFFKKLLPQKMFNFQKTAWKAQHFLVFKGILLKTYIFLTFQPTKPKKRNQRKKHIWGSFFSRTSLFFLRCVPFSGLWDLGLACAWRFAIGFSGALGALRKFGEDLPLGWGLLSC